MIILAKNTNIRFMTDRHYQQIINNPILKELKNTKGGNINKKYLINNI